jgi:hypothetical protein
VRRKGAILALALLAKGCARPEEAAERERVLHALDALRDAPGDALEARRKLLAEVSAATATAPGVVRARDTCALSYRLLLEGTEIQRGVKAELAKGGGEPSALLPRLVDAERKIKQSGTLMPDCEQAIAELRLRRR